MSRPVLLRADGLQAAIRDLRAVSPDAADEVVDLLHARAVAILPLAAARIGQRKRARRRRGRGRPGLSLGQSLRAQRTRRGAAIVNRKPYANIQEEGGSTPSERSPSRRRKAHLVGKHYVGGVLEEADAPTADELVDEVAGVFARHGLAVTHTR